MSSLSLKSCSPFHSFEAHSSFSVIRHVLPYPASIDMQQLANAECQCRQDPTRIWQNMTKNRKTQILIRCISTFFGQMSSRRLDVFSGEAAVRVPEDSVLGRREERDCFPELVEVCVQVLPTSTLHVSRLPVLVQRTSVSFKLFMRKKQRTSTSIFFKCILHGPFNTRETTVVQNCILKYSSDLCGSFALGMLTQLCLEVQKL